MQHKFSDNVVHINIQPETIIEPETNSLYDLKDGITKASWCASENTPGVAAIGCGSGIILVLPLDQYLLAK